MNVVSWMLRLKSIFLCLLFLCNVSKGFQTNALSTLKKDLRVIYVSHVKAKTTATTTISRTTTTTQLNAFFAQENLLLTQCAVAGTLGVVTDPSMIFSQKLLPKDDDGDDIKSTFLYGAVDSISNTARLYASLILLSVVGEWLHWEFLPSTLAISAAPISFSVWLALTLGTAKRSFFLKKVSGTELGRVRLYDDLLDFVIWILTGINILNELQLNTENFQSFFAASGVGALVFSLASKDLAEHIVGGFMLQAWDAFDEGDCIKLGDGTEGKVLKIGLVETEIAGYDNVVTRLPNSQITNQRISNISRTHQSRVKQTLRFSYDDIDKMPVVFEDIKTEIEASCSPALINDGSKTFSARLNTYQEDHIEVVVQCHFDLQPGCGEYYKMKEQFLLAIARAVSNNKVKFAIPAINYVNPEYL